MPNKRNLLTLLILTIFSLSLFITGCGAVSDKVSEKAAEKAIESASGGNAKVDLNNDKVTVTTKDGSLQAGGTSEWPSKIPADVPKFSYGKITSVMESTTTDGQSIIVGIEGVALDDLEKYKGQLEGAGWKITMTSKSEDGYLLVSEKAKNSVTASFSKGDNSYSGGLSYVEVKEK